MTRDTRPNLQTRLPTTSPADPAHRAPRDRPGFGFLAIALMPLAVARLPDQLGRGTGFVFDGNPSGVVKRAEG